MADAMPAQRMEQLVRAYFDACNAMDARGIADCFCPDAVHYFPELPRWVGADTIGSRIAKMIEDRGGRFTVDKILSDVAQNSAAVEWSRFYRQPDRVLRGFEFYVFDPVADRIREIRGYYAASHNPEKMRHELGELDYAGRGYPLA
jgi:hypothetical protein